MNDDWKQYAIVRDPFAALLSHKSLMGGSANFNAEARRTQRSAETRIVQKALRSSAASASLR